MPNITEQDLGFMYKILESAVTSGPDTDRVYQLKVKLIAILKAMEAARAPKAETPVVPESPKVEAEPLKDALDMK